MMSLFVKIKPILSVDCVVVNSVGDICNFNITRFEMVVYQLNYFFGEIPIEMNPFTNFTDDVGVKNVEITISSFGSDPYILNLQLST